MVNDGDKGDYVGRGGLKLEAALAKLGGREKIRGATALDIGASTGGFTECLLREGAREVTALDVGHGQLHEKLKADPRVIDLPRTNFKTVSLKVAPGPFDFFVIDVSFVAARTMLRPLAFRLRPGAEGVILVKPQFELPDDHVRAGQVKSERLRAWALQRVVKKGAELGFEMLGSVDSPVALESGTVEVLTRWKFVGMTEKITGKPGPTVVNRSAPREKSGPGLSPRPRTFPGAKPAQPRLHTESKPSFERPRPESKPLHERPRPESKPSHERPHTESTPSHERPDAEARPPYERRPQLDAKRTFERPRIPRPPRDEPKLDSESTHEHSNSRGKTPYDQPRPAPPPPPPSRAERRGLEFPDRKPERKSSDRSLQFEVPPFPQKSKHATPSYKPKPKHKKPKHKG